jgi:hypothetical protein
MIHYGMDNWQGIFTQAQALPARPRVALLTVLTPPTLATGWLAELVVGVGGTPAEIADAEVLVVALSKQDVNTAHVAAVAWLIALDGWRDLPSVQSGDCYVVDSARFFDAPATDSAGILATILHPEAFTDLLPAHAVRLLELPKP